MEANVNIPTTNNLTKELELAKILKSKRLSENDVVSFLRKNLVNLDTILPGGYNLLHLAIKSENPDIVSIFLSQENSLPSNPNTKSQDSKNNCFLTPLQFAIQQVCDHVSLSKIVKILVKAGADIVCTDEYGRNAVHLVAEKGVIDLVEFLLSKESSNSSNKISLLNTVSQFGTILHIAVINDNTDLLEFLLTTNNLDLSQLDSHKNNALLLSVVAKNFNCFKLLFDFIKDSTELSNATKRQLFNQKNDEGNTLLHELVYAKSNVLLNVVLKLSPDIAVSESEKNNNDHTYLEVQSNLVKMIKDREDEEKRKREALRAEKVRLAEERKKDEEMYELERRKAKEQEERGREMQEKIINNKGKIFFVLFCLFMFGLYFVISNALEKKKRVTVL